MLALPHVFHTLSREDSGEECMNDNTMYTTSSDLELAVDGGCDQLVGIVFPSISLSVAEAAGLANTHLVFDIDEVRPRSSQPVTLRIFGQLSNSAARPSAAQADLSSRARTTETVLWDPPASNQTHELLYSPDISRIVGEILRTPQWAPGNSLAILIERVAGSGVRWVESYAVNQLFAARTGSSGATPALELRTRRAMVP